MGRLSESELLDLYRDWQAALERWGVTHVAADLFYQLLRKLDCTPWGDVLEDDLERLHLKAYPDGATRPTRLTPHPKSKSRFCVAVSPTVGSVASMP